MNDSESEAPKVCPSCDEDISFMSMGGYCVGCHDRLYPQLIEMLGKGGALSRVYACVNACAEAEIETEDLRKGKIELVDERSSESRLDDYSLFELLEYSKKRALYLGHDDMKDRISEAIFALMGAMSEKVEINVDPGPLSQAPDKPEVTCSPVWFNPEPEPIPFVTEDLLENENAAIQRMKVTGGWIVRSIANLNGQICESSVFVPDINHDWKVCK